MNTRNKGGARPAERGCAWIVTILMTLLLAAAILGSAVLQMMASAGLHLSVAADDSMLDKQFRSICENIDMMADELDTPHYEMLCAFGQRLPRIYV